MTAPKGYSTQEKDDRLSAQFSTVEPVREEQFGLSTVSHQFVYEVGTDAAEVGSTAYSIVATGHSALKGDVILLTAGALAGREVKVWAVSSNLITLAETLPSAIANGVSFSILRHKYPSVDSSGKVNVNAVIVEEALSPDGGALPANLKVAGGYDGANVQALKTDAAGELQIDVLSSALPTGAATSALQTDGSQKTQLVDGSGNVIGSTGNALDVNLKTPITVDVSLSQANDSVAVFGNDGAVNRALKTDASGELQVDVLSSALPSGAATEAKQDAANSLLTTIDADTSALSGCVAGSELQVDVVSSALPSGASTSANQTNGSQKSQLVDAAGDVSDVVLLSAALQNTDKGLVTKTSLGSIADVDGQQTMALSLPVVLASDQSAIPVTDNGASLTVDGTVAATQSGTWNITNVSGTVSLPTGAATESTLSTLNTKVPSQGQALMAASLPVVISSNQSAVPSSQSGTWNITNVSGTVSLPTGAATETTLSTLNGKIPSNLTVTSTRLLVDGSGVTQPVSIAATVAVTQNGRSAVNRARNAYASVNVTTGAYVQLLASTSGTVNEVEIFDSSGETLVLATGGAGAEVDQVYVFPGGNGRIPLSIGSGVRVSIKAVSATASAGEIAINFYS